MAHFFISYARIFFFLCFFILIGACADTPKDDYKERSVEELYFEAYGYLRKDNYEKAASTFEEVERQHPYSSWAPRAEIYAAYAFYLAQKYDKAVDILEVFIQTHPGHENVAYAYYLLGLCYYEQISTVDRDQKMTELAFQTFDELVRRFPDSSYAKDARLKMDLTIDHLAGRDMDIGRFYLEIHQPIAAINRFKRVIDKFQTTIHVAEALYRLVEAYLILGVESEAKRIAYILGHNYPQSIWYKDAYSLLHKGSEVVEGEQLEVVEEKEI